MSVCNLVVEKEDLAGSRDRWQSSGVSPVSVCNLVGEKEDLAGSRDGW